MTPALLRGGRAWLFILQHTRWAWAAHVLKLPPFVWAVVIGYRFVARYRSFFSRFLYTRE